MCIVDRYRFYHHHHDCLKSIFMLHNETLNIHSHLIGFIFFLILSIYMVNVSSGKQWEGQKLLTDHLCLWIVSIPWRKYCRSCRLCYILPSGFELSFLLLHLPYLHLSFSPYHQIIHRHLGLHRHRLFDYCQCVSNRAFRILLPTWSWTSIHGLHRTHGQCRHHLSLLQVLGY